MKRRPLQFEPLESRQLMTAIPAAAQIEPLNGVGNNLAHPLWGSANTDLLRKATAAYANGIDSPAGTARPSARAISNALSEAGADDIFNERNLSPFIYAWGQFIDHDMDLTPGRAVPVPFNIPTPANDPQFQGVPILLNRSLADLLTGTSAANPLQQVNVITSYLDGSMIYGSDSARAQALRTLVDGKLKTSAGNLLPLNTAGLPNANDSHQFPDNTLFLAGDVRSNENIELTAIHTLFVREHNRLAVKFKAEHPTWTDEQLFQQARKIVIAEIQWITVGEWLPALGIHLPYYQGYKPNVNASIANEFSAAAFRLHSLINDDVEFLDNDGEEVHDTVALSAAFFNPALVQETGIDPLLKYLATDRAQEVDTKVVGSLRNFLFGQPGQGGFDLVSLNIQRGRDHGLADYNTVRAAYGLPKVTSFAQITSNVELRAALQAQYGNVNNIDLWVGGLSEDHVYGASVGPLLKAIYTDQFTRLRDGDRFWFENQLSYSERYQVYNTTLRDIIRRNSTTQNLQANVFFFNPVVFGSISTPDGVSRARVTVQLLDSMGAVVAETKTDRYGQYSFRQDLDVGQFKVTATVKRGARVFSDTVDVSITKGGKAGPVRLRLR